MFMNLLDIPASVVSPSTTLATVLSDPFNDLIVCQKSLNDLLINWFAVLFNIKLSASYFAFLMAQWYCARVTLRRSARSSPTGRPASFQTLCQNIALSL